MKTTVYLSTYGGKARIIIESEEGNRNPDKYVYAEHQLSKKDALHLARTLLNFAVTS